ncbi:MAG: hypothetical protein PVSMB8_00520 [Vulcanimicrobiaceae bacterium]
MPLFAFSAILMLKATLLFAASTFIHAGASVFAAVDTATFFTVPCTACDGAALEASGARETIAAIVRVIVRVISYYFGRWNT